MMITLPNNGISWWHFEFFEKDIESMNAVVVLYDATWTSDPISDRNLRHLRVTLNLLSLSSLKTNEVGPVSWTK